MPKRPQNDELRAPEIPGRMDASVPLMVLDDGSRLTAAGAIENSAEFRKRAQEAWNRTRQLRGTEAGFTVEDSGPSRVEFAHQGEPGADALGSLQQVKGPATRMLLHTHGENPRPSQADVEMARRLGVPIAVLGRDGLYEVDAEGNIRLVESGLSWLGQR